MAKKMFVMGAYGCGNRGDDAILQSICQLFPNWEICATNGAYENVGAFLHIRTVPCRLNEGFSLSILGSMIKDSFRLLREIAKADLLMFGGGSLVHDLTPYNLPFLFFWQMWAKLFGKKVCYFSMGVGPLNTSTGRRLSRFFLKRADGLFVRDRRGYDLCLQLGVKNGVLTADAAFAVTSKNQCGGTTLCKMGLTPNSYFCVTASQWFESSNFWNRNQMDFSEQIEKLAQTIRLTAHEQGLPVVFVPTVVHDVKLGQILSEKLSDIDYRIVPVEWNCMQMAEIIENSFFLLGVRMHSIIFAARQQVPFIALIYDEKVRQLLKYLEIEDCGLPLDNLSPEMTAKYVVDMTAAHTQIENKLKNKTKDFNMKIACAVEKIDDIVFAFKNVRGGALCESVLFERTICLSGLTITAPKGAAA